MTGAPPRRIIRSPWTRYRPLPLGERRDMLILGIILFGLVVGAAAQYVLGTGRAGVDWGMALIATVV